MTLSIPILPTYIILKLLFTDVPRLIFLFFIFINILEITSDKMSYTLFLVIIIIIKYAVKKTLKNYVD